jgi:hypothetical protein
VGFEERALLLRKRLLFMKTALSVRAGAGVSRLRKRVWERIRKKNGDFEKK